MCKFDQVIYVDNAHRGESSTSDSYFDIDLDHALLLNDNNGVAVKSLTIGNPIKTVNADINDKLYFRLGVLDRVLTLTANNYSPSTLVTELQFPPSRWTMSSTSISSVQESPICQRNNGSAP